MVILKWIFLQGEWFANEPNAVPIRSKDLLPNPIYDARNIMKSIERLEPTPRTELKCSISLIKYIIEILFTIEIINKILCIKERWRRSYLYYWQKKKIVR